MKTHIDGTTGRETVRMTLETARGCSHAGDCLEDVRAAMGRVEWVATVSDLRRNLREYGAWDDLDEVADETIRERALWCAACDIAENPQDYA